MKALHEFKNFTVSLSVSGDYFIETDNGEDILLLSPNGSKEHNNFSRWIESNERTESDFEEAFQN